MQSRGDWLEQRYRHSSEDSALQERYGEDFDFTIPPGVDFISADENVHFSSVLAYHADSKTIYSDDTLMYLRLPQLARWLVLGDSVSFHPTLAKALEQRAGAAQDFQTWPLVVHLDSGSGTDFSSAIG